MKKEKGVFLTPEEQLQYIRERSYSERYAMLLRLIRIGKMLSQVKTVKGSKI